MNQQDLQDPVNETAAPGTGGRQRPVLAFLGTFVVTAACFPIHLFLIFMFSTASQSYDTGGSGGPFKSCDSETYCSDPNYAWMLGTSAAMVILWLVAAQVGQLVWDPRPRAKRLLALAAFSVTLTAAGFAIVYYVITHATHSLF